MIGVFNVLFCCIAMIIQGQQAAPCTHVKLAQHDATAGTQDTLISEQLTHTQRVARLMVIQQLAIQDDYAEISSACNKLLVEEYKRHNEFISQWTQSRGSDTNEVNDAWWKDVGTKQKNPDSNSSSVLLKTAGVTQR